MRRWVGIVLCVVGAWGCRGNADFSDVMPEPVILSAEEYRQEITDIDRLVFTEGPFDEIRRKSLSGKLEQLARRMKASSDSRYIAIEVLEVRRLAEVAKRVPPKPPSSMLGNQWMRIRSNVFDDRSWFARRAADLEPVRATEPPREDAALAKPAPAPSIPPAKVSAAHDLEGRWRVKEIYGNGKLRNDPEQSGALWTFAGNQLSMSSAAGESSRFTVTRIRDARGTALWLKSDDSAAVSESGWMIYELVDGTLKVAFQDGLGDRPESFEPPGEGREPLFVTLLLRRES
jgi:uncharacterized protein (TIGR03067 family)